MNRTEKKEIVKFVATLVVAGIVLVGWVLVLDALANCGRS